jgi:hypothetical protein
MIDSGYQIDPNEIVTTLYSKEALAVVSCFNMLGGTVVLAISLFLVSFIHTDYE